MVNVRNHINIQLLFESNSLPDTMDFFIGEEEYFCKLGQISYEYVPISEEQAQMRFVKKTNRTQILGIYVWERNKQEVLREIIVQPMGVLMADGEQIGSWRITRKKVAQKYLQSKVIFLLI